MSFFFDATSVAPEQGGVAHPVGTKFPAVISNTEIKPTDKGGYYLEVEYTTPAGKISDRLNLWNASPKAVTIAQGTLSAICHCINVYRLQTNNAAELRNGQLMIDVRQQSGDNSRYTEVSRRYDRNGNEPGKPATAGPQPQPQQQQPAPGPQPQQGGWPSPGSPVAPQQQQPGNWPSPQGPPLQQPPMGGPQPSQGGWTTNPQGAPASPPANGNSNWTPPQQPQPLQGGGPGPIGPPPQQWQQNAPQGGGDAAPWSAPR